MEANGTKTNKQESLLKKVGKKVGAAVLAVATVLPFVPTDAHAASRNQDHVFTADQAKQIQVVNTNNFRDGLKFNVSSQNKSKIQVGMPGKVKMQNQMQMNNSNPANDYAGRNNISDDVEIGGL